MGDKDLFAKECLSDNEIFADAFNYLIYGGEQVIDPDKLRPVDTEVIGVPYGNDDSGTPVQRYRDLLKALTVMKDESRVYLLLGIEAQSEDNYAMPVRNMVYDALQYAKQVEEAAKAHRKSKPDRTITSGEYLSGFYSDDRLVPVITLVLYLSPDEWKGPRSLHEMFSMEDPKILRYVSDYKLNILCPAELSEEELNRMTSELHEIFIYTKYSRDQERLDEMVQKYESFRSLDIKAVRLIRAVTNSSELKIDETKENIDMCQALMDMKRDAAMAGEKRGEQQKARKMVINMLKLGGFSVETIAKIAEISISEVEAIRAEIGAQ